MKHVSLKLTDAEFEKLEMLRGNKTKSDYLRELLSRDQQETRKELGDFERLFQDVNEIRQTLAALISGLPDQKGLIALAEYLKDVMSISNPPAYSNYADRLQELLQKLKANLKI